MIVMRPTGLGLQNDFSVVWKEPGRERHVGRILYTENATAKGVGVWFWTVEFHQRGGREEPHQGNADSKEAAKAAWRRCWDSADVPVKWPP